MANEQHDNLSVLVVDDEAVARTMLGRVLRKNGWEVELASDAHQAIKAMARRPFDVVLTDLVMDGMDGIQVGRGEAR